MLGRLRAKYEQAVAPVGRVLADAGLSPNTMTVASLLIATASAYVYAMGMAPWGALLIVATGVFDMFDGAIARATGKTSRFGATLDHVTDRYAECFIVCGMIYGGYTPWYWGVFTLFGMLMASFTRAKAESVGGLERCTVGIAERQEKLILLIGGSLLHGYVGEALNYAVILVGVLSHLTVAQRLHYTWKQTGGK
ncbi:MAG: CDP-alcohol phosphatidyltransferase family protein [Candidatus Bathyarchaeota archaeon]|nr:CDP-alcohol phosphatidyltransferase family protein [Candidatus Bathyarchaeota archaeon]